MCPIAANVSRSGKLPETWFGDAFDAFAVCAQAQHQLAPVVAALENLEPLLQAALAAAEKAMPVNGTLVAQLERELRQVASTANLIGYLERCEGTVAVLQELAPVVCDGIMVTATTMWLLLVVGLALACCACCGAKTYAQHARARYRRFTDHDDYLSLRSERASERQPFVVGKDADDSLASYESSYGSTSSTRRSTAIWNH